MTFTVDVDWKNGPRQSVEFSTRAEAITHAAKMAMDVRIDWSSVRDLGEDASKEEKIRALYERPGTAGEKAAAAAALKRIGAVGTTSFKKKEAYIVYLVSDIKGSKLQYQYNSYYTGSKQEATQKAKADAVAKYGVSDWKIVKLDGPR